MQISRVLAGRIACRNSRRSPHWKRYLTIIERNISWIFREFYLFLEFVNSSKMRNEENCMFYSHFLKTAKCTGNLRVGSEEQKVDCIRCKINLHLGHRPVQLLGAQLKSCYCYSLCNHCVGKA